MVQDPSKFFPRVQIGTLKIHIHLDKFGVFHVFYFSVFATPLMVAFMLFDKNNDVYHAIGPRRKASNAKSD